MTKILKYVDFLNEQTNNAYGVLYIEEDNFDEGTWIASLNISKLWKQYEEKDISVKKFNEYYIKFLQQNKDFIVENIGLDCWNDIEPLLLKLNKAEAEEDCYGIYDDLYDVYDRNLIELKT